MHWAVYTIASPFITCCISSPYFHLYPLFSTNLYVSHHLLFRLLYSVQQPCSSSEFFHFFLPSILAVQKFMPFGGHSMLSLTSYLFISYDLPTHLHWHLLCYQFSFVWPHFWFIMNYDSKVSSRTHNFQSFAYPNYSTFQLARKLK